MPGKRRRDDRDPWGIRNPNNYLDARYAPSAPRYSYNRGRMFNPQEYMGRGLRAARNRVPVFRENGRYYFQGPGGRQYFPTLQHPVPRGQSHYPDWRYYAVHNEQY